MLVSLAFAAIAATSPEGAFDAAVDAHYVAMSDKAVCASGCAQTIVAKKSIGDAGTIELRKATADYGDVYAIVFGRGDTWFAADPLDDIDVDDCGAGTCVTDLISSVSMMRRGEVAWVTLRLATTVSHAESRASHVRHQIVVGCALGAADAAASSASVTRGGAAPTCLQVNAGSHWDDGRAVILRDAIHVVDGNGTHDEPIAF